MKLPHPCTTIVLLSTPYYLAN